MARNIMLIADVAKIPHLVSAAREHGHGQRVDGRIAEPLVVEAGDVRAVEVREVRRVGLGAEEVQVADLEVGEELAVVVLAAVAGVVDEPAQVGVGVHEVGPPRHKLTRASPQAGETARVVEDVHVEAVGDAVVAHEPERVVRDVAEEVHVGLDAPVVRVRGERGVLVEEAAVPAAHVAVGEEISLADA